MKTNKGFCLFLDFFVIVFLMWHCKCGILYIQCVKIYCSHFFKKVFLSLEIPSSCSSNMTELVFDSFLAFWRRHKTVFQTKSHLFLQKSVISLLEMVLRMLIATGLSLCPSLFSREH